jgi:hypothetical protein
MANRQGAKRAKGRGVSVRGAKGTRTTDGPFLEASRGLKG